MADRTSIITFDRAYDVLAPSFEFGVCRRGFIEPSNWSLGIWSSGMTSS
jgi:hypothetical protein